MKIQERFDILPLSPFLLLSIFINNTWSRTEQNTKRAIKSPSASAAFEEGFEASLPGGGDATAKPQPAQTLMEEQEGLAGPDPALAASRAWAQPRVSSLETGLNPRITSELHPGSPRSRAHLPNVFDLNSH